MRLLPYCTSSIQLFDFRNGSHLLENLDAANLQFTADELQKLDTAISNIKIHGDR